jgi:hypothetical protein
MLVAERSDVIDPGMGLQPTGEFIIEKVDIETFYSSRIIDTSYQND